MDAAVAEPKQQHAEAENESRPQPHVETQDSEHADASASSSGWSSDEDETDEASALGQMAQSMLAALRSSQQRAPYTTLPAGAPQQRVQSRDRGHGGTRPGALHASRPAAVEKEAGGEIKVAEVHWEPAVQLPALQFADADKIEDILRKVEPVPTGQVIYYQKRDVTRHPTTGTKSARHVLCAFAKVQGAAAKGIMIGPLESGMILLCSAAGRSIQGCPADR